MWCIPDLTETYIEQMEEILSLYAKPYNEKQPVLCFDEKSIQLLETSKGSLARKKGKPLRTDYEYKRHGTKNLFVTVEPQNGFRTVCVTSKRTKKDFAREIKRITSLKRYEKAETIHVVLDNLNTHFEKSFYETFTEEQAKVLLKKIQFHYTPKHASWLNMAEIEIGVLSRQCLRTRIASEKKLKREVRCWQGERNRQRKEIHWQFSVKDAREKFKYEGQD